MFKCSLTSPVTHFSTCAFIILDYYYGIVLIKEPAVERKPEAPKPSVAPVKQKMPPSKVIQSHIVVELFSGLFVSLWYVFACFVSLMFFTWSLSFILSLFLLLVIMALFYLKSQLLKRNQLLKYQGQLWLQ